MKKIWLFFGWMSNEHDVSLLSAKKIIHYIDTWKYTLQLIYWWTDGKFYAVDTLEEVSLLSEDKRIPVEDLKNYFEKALLMTHGKYGEDWVLQSILEVYKIPYCGCRVLSSALCMNKWLFKMFLQWHTIQQTKFMYFDGQFWNQEKLETIIDEVKTVFQLPIYIKPCNSWSSVGITRVDDFEHLSAAISTARTHDNKILIEQGLVHPQEIEVAVVGNDTITISQPWELILTKDFYDYEDKYTRNEARVILPAKLSSKQIQEIQSIASKAYTLCDCRGFARIDFFVSGWQIYLNEINTLPWFTDISMFPMLMNYSWVPFQELISQIIELWY